MVHAEISQDALIELEAQLSGVPVIHPLGLGIVHVLAGVLVFQFQGENGDAVEHQHHIHGFVVIRRVVPLANHIANVLLIKGSCRLVQMGLRAEIAHPEGNAPVLETVTQHGNQAVGITGIVECDAEFADRVTVAGVDKAGPLLRLGRLDKVDKGINVETNGRVVCISGFGVSTLLS